MPTRHPVEHAIATPVPLIAVTRASLTRKSEPNAEKLLVSAKHAVGAAKQIRPITQSRRLHTVYRSRKKLENTCDARRVGCDGSGMKKSITVGAAMTIPSSTAAGNAVRCRT